MVIGITGLLIVIILFIISLMMIIFYVGEKISNRFPSSKFAKFWNDYICMGVPDNEDM